MRITNELKNEVLAEIEREHWQGLGNLLARGFDIVLLGACLYSMICLIYVLG